MIYKLNEQKYSNVRALFKEFEHQLTINAVIDTTLEGKIYVDNIDSPRSAYMITPEGQMIAGNSENDEFNCELKKLIPFNAYLQFMDKKWKDKLPSIWDNKYVWEESRTYMTIQPSDFETCNWSELLEEGYTAEKVDKNFLKRPLKNMDSVLTRVEEWGSIEKFENLAYGFCIVYKDSIVARCISDNVYLDRTECGIWTDRHHRGKGLARIIVSIAVEHCFNNGLKEVGWHCLSNNIGSIKTANKVGFKEKLIYSAYGTDLPGESQGDLTKDEWLVFAKRYDKIVKDQTHPVKGVSYIYAAAAYSLAGLVDEAIMYLNKMKDSGWRNDYSFIVDDWSFWGLHGTEQWDSFVKSIS